MVEGVGLLPISMMVAYPPALRHSPGSNTLQSSTRCMSVLHCWGFIWVQEGRDTRSRKGVKQVGLSLAHQPSQQTRRQCQGRRLPVAARSPTALRCRAFTLRRRWPLPPRGPPCSSGSPRSAPCGSGPCLLDVGWGRRLGLTQGGSKVGSTSWWSVTVASQQKHVHPVVRQQQRQQRRNGGSGGSSVRSRAARQAGQQGRSGQGGAGDVPMNTTRLYRFSPSCQGLPSPSLLLPNCSIMCTPWNTNLQG